MSEFLTWRPKFLSENVLRYADFADELDLGTTVLTGAASASVWSGNDPSPNAIIGTVSVQTNSTGVATVVSVALSGGVVGTIYQVSVTATSSSGRIIIKVASFVVKPGLN